MSTAARLEIHPVQNSVVFVGHQFVYDVLVLGAGHKHQVLESISKVSSVIHVNVRRAAAPSRGAQVQEPLDHEPDFVGLPFAYGDFGAVRPVLEAPHRGYLQTSGRSPNSGLAGCMKEMLA